MRFGIVLEELKMKRILIFAGYFLPSTGGYETNIYELSKRLARKGYKIDIITCNKENARESRELPIYEEYDDICIYRLPSWNFLDGNYPVPKPILTTFTILSELLRGKYDLINTQSRIFFMSFLGLIFAKVKIIPLLHTERGTRHSVVSSRIVDLISRTYDHTIGSLIVKSAWKNTGVSNAACDFLKHLGAKETIVIHNGIDTNVFRKKENNLREKLGFDNTILITFVGRLIYAKGVQDVISIFPSIKEKFDNVKLLIIGDGSYRPELEKLAEKTDKGNILFLGQMTHEEIAEILNITDIFVNPSYSEGLPTSVLEAGAIGLPIIATDVGGTNEIIENYKTGFLIPDKDIKALEVKICELIENKDLRGKVGRNAHEFIKQNFNWDKIADEWIHEIGGMLNETKYR